VLLILESKFDVIAKKLLEGVGPSFIVTFLLKEVVNVLERLFLLVLRDKGFDVSEYLVGLYELSSRD